MGKLPYGPATKHIKQSYGGDTDPLKHYCTQYGTKYGQHFSKFEPRTGRHCGTGYQSNFRPGVYYSARLDQVDNPAMGVLVADNYSSVTQKSFRPYTTPTGNEALPYHTHQTGSGFIRQKNVNIPNSGEVYGVAIDTRIACAPADVIPRHRPHLHKIQGKDTTELENGGYGPRFMSTETHEKYQGQQRNPTGPNVCFKSDGSGFTHAYNVEPITFHPDYAHRNEAPGWLTDRPTGVSIHASDFHPLRVPHGGEPLPKIANRSNRDTGFTSGTRTKPGFVHDKGSGMPDNPNNRPADPSDGDRAPNVAVGKKELSGFSANHERYVQTSDNPARFITHYQTRFLDKTPFGTDREGHVWGGVQRQKPDGYTRSTSLHTTGPDYDSTAVRRGMEPYVGRSIVARDPFFDEHHIDHKIHKQMSMACF